LDRLLHRTSLLLICALLLVPKSTLLQFSSDVLSVPLGFRDWLALLLQDTALAIACWSVLSWLLGRPSAGKLALGFLSTGALLLVLLIDCRARELWLQPLNLEILRYGLAASDDLVSGHEVFFKRPAGFGMTMRRLILLAGLAHLVLWAAVALSTWRRVRGRARAGSTRTPGSWIGAAAGLSLALLCTSAALAPSVHSMEQNIFVRPLVTLIRPDERGTTEDAARLAGQFEQQTRPAHELLATTRRIAAAAAPFKNLVLVMLESVRWNGMNLDAATESRTPAPFLRKLASEGILVRSRVSLPHSSKSYYSVMTGRHPWPGIEMVESIKPRNESLFWELAERQGGGAATHCFSSMSLAFENLDGLLRSLGIERRRLLGDEQVSSFGHCDELLLQSVPELAAGTGPFAALYLPLAAHYPYDYPGKPADQGDGLQAYLDSVSYTDGFLSRLIERLLAAGLLQDTLVVLVGDHGESFGEHGTVIHNNSMYEEEVTAPLVFWSADRRLRTEGVLTASHIDIAPTVLDLMGLCDSDLAVQGQSLLRADTPGVAYIASFFDGTAQARVEGDWKVIHFPTSGDILSFDLALDPEEQRPAEVGDAERRAWLKQQFAAHAAYQRSLFGR
jgi:hypothetical protein